MSRASGGRAILPPARLLARNSISIRAAPRARAETARRRHGPPSSSDATSRDSPAAPVAMHAGTNDDGCTPTHTGAPHKAEGATLAESPLSHRRSCESAARRAPFRDARAKKVTCASIFSSSIPSRAERARSTTSVCERPALLPRLSANWRWRPQKVRPSATSEALPPDGASSDHRASRLSSYMEWSTREMDALLTSIAS